MIRTVSSAVASWSRISTLSLRATERECAWAISPRYPTTKASSPFMTLLAPPRPRGRDHRRAADRPDLGAAPRRDARGT